MEHIIRYFGQNKTSLILNNQSYRQEIKVGKMRIPDFQKVNKWEDTVLRMLAFM